MQPTSGNVLLGKTAVVTGASRGLGCAAALRLAKDGALVVVQFNRDRDSALAVVDEIRGFGGKATAIPAELASLQSITQFYEQLDANLRELTDSRSVDILVNSAGVVESMDFESTTEITFDRLFDVNVKGTFFMIPHSFSRDCRVCVEQGGGEHLDDTLGRVARGARHHREHREPWGHRYGHERMGENQPRQGDGTGDASAGTRRSAQ
jgi:NAD(P)-dependent dehydrogenase (short-subunit alcohol dehydrogenase family)